MMQDIEVPKKFAAVAAKVREKIKETGFENISMNWDTDTERLAVSFAAADERAGQVLYIQRPVIMTGYCGTGAKAATPQVFSATNGWYDLRDRQETARFEQDVSLLALKR